jgi:hypothetical protein
VAIPDLVAHFLKRPGMFVWPEEFHVYCAFLSGFDQACCGGPLVGFREWLITKLDGGDNLSWCDLVLRAAFPNSSSPNSELRNTAGQQHAIGTLFSLLTQFDGEASKLDGLRCVFVRYERWLSTKSWYHSPCDPSSNAGIVSAEGNDT